MSANLTDMEREQQVAIRANARRQRGRIARKERRREDLQTLADHGIEIRHDLYGYYGCTVEEGEHEDEGRESVGFDGRPHFATLEAAEKALARTLLSGGRWPYPVRVR